MTAPTAKERSDPSPGAPSPDHPVRGPPRLFTEVRRPSVCGTPRMTNLFLRSSNPSRFSRISPNSRISAGFSKFSFRAGLNSATKRGLLFGSVAMNAGSMVKLFSSGWQVPHVRPLPAKVSLKKRSRPFAMSRLRGSEGGADLQPSSPTTARRTQGTHRTAARLTAGATRSPKCIRVPLSPSAARSAALPLGRQELVEPGRGRRHEAARDRDAADDPEDREEDERDEDDSEIEELCHGAYSTSRIISI